MIDAPVGRIKTDVENTIIVTKTETVSETMIMVDHTLVAQVIKGILVPRVTLWRTNKNLDDLTGSMWITSTFVLVKGVSRILKITKML
jgi:hypothetical protein